MTQNYPKHVLECVICTLPLLKVAVSVKQSDVFPRMNGFYRKADHGQLHGHATPLSDSGVRDRGRRTGKSIDSRLALASGPTTDPPTEMCQAMSRSVFALTKRTRRRCAPLHTEEELLPVHHV